MRNIYAKVRELFEESAGLGLQQEEKTEDKRGRNNAVS